MRNQHNLRSRHNLDTCQLRKHQSLHNDVRSAENDDQLNRPRRGRQPSPHPGSSLRQDSPHSAENTRVGRLQEVHRGDSEGKSGSAENDAGRCRDREKNRLRPDRGSNRAGRKRTAAGSKNARLQAVGAFGPEGPGDPVDVAARQVGAFECLSYCYINK